ncbi:hypothetical protein B0H12DRAFT_1125457 [Mycena haematopus]|nr:hypothetical protein B0H12DRAFT_1125457 [Mycena haematopus]
MSLRTSSTPATPTRPDGFSLVRIRTQRSLAYPIHKEAGPTRIHQGHRFRHRSPLALYRLKRRRISEAEHKRSTTDGPRVATITQVRPAATK